MIRAAAFPRGLPVLSGLSDELLDAWSLRPVNCRCGRMIGLSARVSRPRARLIVISGRLEVIDEGRGKP